MQQALIDLLRRWLRGETRGSEESRLERAAQEDPFLADAWEGYSQNLQADHSHKLDELNARIVAKTGADQQKTRSILIWLPRLAAAASVLLLLTFGWKWIFSPNSSGNLGVNVPVIESNPAEKPNPSAPVVPEIADVQVEKVEKNRPLKPNHKTNQGPQPGRSSADARSEQDEVTTEENLAAVAINETKPKPLDQDDTPGNATSNRATGNTAEKELAKITSVPSVKDSNTFQAIPTVGGIIVDERGQRAAGIPVQRDANTFAITNQNGAFELPSATPAKVQVVDPEFEKQSFNLHDNAEKVVLQRKTKAQKKSFDASDRREGVGYPSPVGGFEKFEQYIRENLETPYEAKRNFISGDVTLEFTFEKDGTPSRISVLRSLGFGCDQAAEHLIENGPKWRNVKPGTWVIYKVVFK